MLSKAEPIHQIPLLRSDLTNLGRFAVIFGQIDHYLTHILCHLVYVDVQAGHLAMENMTTGVKVNALRRNLFRIEDEALRKKAADFCENIGGILERRNHMFHGIWGWHMPNATTQKPACFYAKNDKKPVSPERLDAYCVAAANLSVVLHEIFCRLVGTDLPPPENPHPKFCFGSNATEQELKEAGYPLEPVGRSFRDRQDQEKTPKDAAPKSG